MRFEDIRSLAMPLSAPWETFGDIDAELTAKLIAATADIALFVDGDGIVRDVSIGGEQVPRELCENWLGKDWIDTVTIESRPKIEALRRDATAQGNGRWRQVNHPNPGEPDLPVRYHAVSVGRDGSLVAIGRDLQAMASLQQRLVDAQQAMEREYARIRNAEGRYRLLFQLTSEPVVIVDAATGRVSDANPAAARFLGVAGKRLAGRPLADLFDRDSAGAIETLQAAARVNGRADDVRARVQNGPDAVLWASLFRQDKTTQLLLRIMPADGSAEGPAPMKSLAISVVENMPEAFVVTDVGRKILMANAAFLELVQVATEEQVRGEVIDRWLGRPAVDMDVLAANLEEHGMVRRLASIVRGELGSVEDVELNAVSVDAEGATYFGFAISFGRVSRPGVDPRPVMGLPKSVDQLTSLVGRTSLKEIVRETTEIIEKLCIEAALQVTSDNRASAAEMLGLSRQGLYSKLRRYNLGDGEPEPAIGERSN